ncbi:hypothetical protein INT48_006394 [Thamnidium elegans]|uniref:Uncharacterized protein n=1 Tax=Thamnidium elegans TaxID=101142 RepID=A0A8H7VWV3_9FUNG|nr:hypothetical protein INT48_006394 [Thamnidium elegans]
MSFGEKFNLLLQEALNENTPATLEDMSRVITEKNIQLGSRDSKGSNKRRKTTLTIVDEMKESLIKIGSKLPDMLQSRVHRVNGVSGFLASGTLADDITATRTIKEAAIIIGRAINRATLLSMDNKFFKRLFRWYLVQLRDILLIYDMTHETINQYMVRHNLIVNQTDYTRGMWLGGEVQTIYRRLGVEGLLAIEVIDTKTIRSGKQFDKAINYLQLFRILPKTDTSSIDFLFEHLAT